ncbi:hypothetical protein EV363DRAFT_1154916 [Boletus edulis]|nr:hypothetical protein EV363DRAFT_1154916 [Boletus edulis]
MAPVFSCRWDWCRSSFASIDALHTHVKLEHIWPMKPMRKAEIALMRRMDLQSLHSSPNTDSSIVSQGLITGVSPTKTPLLAAPSTSTPTTFAQLSSPPQTLSPQRLPASPAFESLVGQDRHSGLSAAMKIFERAHGHKPNQHPRLSPHQRSPTHRPISESSGSSQEIVEQQLTQEEDVGLQPPPLLPSELSVERELVDAELRWPTDDELDVFAIKRTTKQPVSTQNDRPSSSPDSARGRNFRDRTMRASQ